MDRNCFAGSEDNIENYLSQMNLIEEWDTYIHTYMHACIHTYLYKERERESGREGERERE
jgi:hypothetical protein